MIESYSFGRMVINGKTYSSDLIIYPDGHIQDSWCRKEGHRLVEADIVKLIESVPEIIVVGTGASGLMTPTKELENSLAHKNMDLIAQPTSNAMELFNQLLSENKKVGGCFHLTC